MQRISRGVTQVNILTLSPIIIVKRQAKENYELSQPTKGANYQTLSLLFLFELNSTLYVHTAPVPCLPIFLPLGLSFSFSLPIHITNTIITTPFLLASPPPPLLLHCRCLQEKKTFARKPRKLVVYITNT